jgi:hypothetical protein
MGCVGFLDHWRMPAFAMAWAFAVTALLAGFGDRALAR